MNRPHIAVACATDRGVQFVRHLASLRPDANITIFSFREDPWEPPFLDRLKVLAEEVSADIFETRQLDGPDLVNFWEKTPPDILFAVSWRYMLPGSVFSRPARGSFIFHDSMLPNYRGFAPTVWAMINGEQQTGVTLFKLSDSHPVVDSGPIVSQRAVPIGLKDTIGVTMGHVTATYLEILEENLDNLIEGTAELIEQNEDDATYTCKRTPADALIDWSRPAYQIYNLIRASTVPYSGAFSYLNGVKVTIWHSELVERSFRYVGSIPGRVLERRSGEGVVVMTGQGLLLVRDVEIPELGKVTAERVARSISDRFGV